MQKKGITIIEVIVSIAIIGMLFSLIFTAMGTQNKFLNRLDITKDLYSEVNSVLAKAVIGDVNPQDGVLDGVTLYNPTVEFDMEYYPIEINGYVVDMEVMFASKTVNLDNAESFTYNFKPVEKGYATVGEIQDNVNIDVIPVSSPFPISKYYVNGEPYAEDGLLDRMYVTEIPPIDNNHFNILKINAHSNYVNGDNIVYDKATGNNLEVSDLLVKDNKVKSNRYVVHFTTDEPVIFKSDSDGDFEMDLTQYTNQGVSSYNANLDIVFICRQGFGFDFETFTIKNPQSNFTNVYFLSETVHDDNIHINNILPVTGGQVTIGSTGFIDQPLNIYADRFSKGVFFYFPNQEVTIHYTTNENIHGGIVSKGNVNFQPNTSFTRDNFIFESWNGDYGALGYIYK